jgi:hypothetical protein
VSTGPFATPDDASGADAGGAPAWPASDLADPWGRGSMSIVSSEAAPSDHGDLFGMTNGSTAHAGPAADDPRLAILGVTPDFAAAGLEAGSNAAALAARLAGLASTDEPAAGSAETHVVVTGLVSVASIAGFKRHLARAVGVQAVGVSSGPDGEFVFSVTHDSPVVMRDVVTAIPDFSVRITADRDGELIVSARDPETDH